MTSDFQINSHVRSVLARHMIDMRLIEYSSCRGTLRFRGSLVHLGLGVTASMSPATVRNLEMELGSISGVRRTYFDLVNWRKNETEDWEPVLDHASRCGESASFKMPKDLDG